MKTSDVPTAFFRTFRREVPHFPPPPSATATCKARQGIPHPQNKLFRKVANAQDARRIFT